MKTYIYSTHFNMPEYIELQLKSLKKYFQNNFKFIVINDAKLEGDLTNFNQTDLNEKINPVEADLKWAIAKKRKEVGGFNGWEKIKNLLANGSEKIRVGIKPDGKVIARENTKIFSSDNNEIGFVTSGTFGPSVNAPVAMGYVKSEFSEIGTSIQLEVRGKKYGGKISELPFYKKSYVK